jgi:tyrosine-protein kinase Etk/Wzc
MASNSSEHSDTTSVTNEPTASAEGREVGLFNVIHALWEKKLTIIAISIVAGAVAFTFVSFLPNQFTATAKILPPQPGNSSASTILNQLGGLASVASGSIPSLRNPSDLYASLLKSRTVADRLIDRFELRSYFNEDSRSVTQAKLAEVTKINAGRDGLITISVELKSPSLAASVTNAYVEELIALTGTLALTEAAQRRQFFERQLALVKSQLGEAEKQARTALNTSGLVVVESQGRALVEISARLRAQVTSKEIQLSAMQSYAAPENPELQLVKQELTALRTQLAKLEGTQRPFTTHVASIKQNDSVGLLRELRYFETLHEILSKQTEIARLDEARDYSAVQTIDTAIEPDKKSRPKRMLIVLSTMFGALAISLIIFGILAVI